jgi:hypothetical protein
MAWDVSSSFFFFSGITLPFCVFFSFAGSLPPAPNANSFLHFKVVCPFYWCFGFEVRDKLQVWQRKTPVISTANQ